MVIDLDGDYRAVGAEQVVSLAEAAEQLDITAEAERAILTLPGDDFLFYAAVVGASYACANGAAEILLLGAGVYLTADVRSALSSGEATVLLPSMDSAGAEIRTKKNACRIVRGHGGLMEFEGGGSGSGFSRNLCLLRGPDDIVLLRRLASDWHGAGSALETFAAVTPVTVDFRPELLVGSWRAIGETAVDDEGRVRVDGAPVAALDLTRLDARRPWTLDAKSELPPRVLLSEHLALAAVVAEEAERRASDAAAGSADGRGDLAEADDSVLTRVDDIIRSEARRADQAKASLPRVLGADGDAALRSWALELMPIGDMLPVARYLAAVRLARPDLVQAFRDVPGPDSGALARWALQFGVSERGHDHDLLAEAAALTKAAQDEGMSLARGKRTPGVNLVGYLSGELGLGESARLVDDALQAAGVATSTYDVSRDIESRRGATYRQSEPSAYKTSLLCVNGAETAAVAPRLAPLLTRSRVIGMWYWELEDFATAHQAGFRHVDEVWAATDFVRDAIARHAEDIPVRTVMPPLPQAGEDPGVIPETFGIPEDRPWFLFTFDFLSLAPRKNPYGLVEAFTQAFADLPIDDRPLLVIKTINAERFPAYAERLRFQIVDRPDIRFVDAYLENDQRHVLVSHCTAYVSLHKAEGLGLTVAEAMAWGKPVITTAYGGVTQFCDSSNSFLVDWRRGYIEEAAGPYEKGLPWGEPDLDQAAQFMRLVIDDPARAAQVGAQAASDIREKHSAEMAGVRMKAVLEEGDERWRRERALARAERQAARRGQTSEGAAPDGAPGVVAGSLRLRHHAARARRTAGRAWRRLGG